MSPSFAPIRRFAAGALALGLGLGLAAPASAISFASSSTTGQSAVIIPLRTGGAVGPLDMSLGLRLSPSASSLLGPGNVTAGLTELSSWYIDGDLTAGYRYTLMNVNFMGRFNPAIMPFVGYRGLGAITAEGSTNLTGAGGALSTAYLHGLQYGIGAATQIPFGFSAFARGGLTTLLGGHFDTRNNSTSVTNQGNISVGGATLPMGSVGISWGIGPLLRLSLGYDVFVLPTNMRALSTTLGAGRSTINNLSVGIGIAGLSF